MIGSFLGYGAVSAVLGAVLYANMPTKYTIGHVIPTVSYLSKAKLIKLDSEKDALTGKTIEAKQIFDQGPVLVMAVRRPGCTFCRKEASELTQIKDKLDAAGVRLMGVVHEYQGVDQFKPFLKGDVYYDTEKTFYGPEQRWLPFWIGFLRVNTYLNGFNSRHVPGNYEGEGRLLGGVYLINKDQMLFSHLEKDWGDAVDPNDVLEAIKKIH
uniref:Peroxiredoxin-like 2 activated in M-CSF stimulated monocytes n=1 Tax=Panagrolaimus sp. JU765 TaxID=591449 RepID=A0AC34R457_9BILA